MIIVEVERLHRYFNHGRGSGGWRNNP